MIEDGDTVATFKEMNVCSIPMYVVPLCNHIGLHLH